MAIFNRTSDREHQLHLVAETMRALSSHTDPQELVADFRRHMANLMDLGRMLSLSRRGVESPRVVLARDSAWPEQPDPWRQRDQLPVLSGGMLGELIYAGEPRIIDDLQVAADDPAYEILEPYRSLMAVPVYDAGRVMNMPVFLSRESNAYAVEQLTFILWTSNLLGRASHNLVLRRQLTEAHDELDREMQVIGELQRALLPQELPAIPGLDLAVHYQPAARAGGDFYDLFPLEAGRWGMLIGDVSGHGSPAAVLMAITHALTHTQPHADPSPAELFEHVNHHLADRYTGGRGQFVTAFFGIFDPADRTLCYTNAGHHPPRIKRCADGSLFTLDQAVSYPLGILHDTRYEMATTELQPADQLVLFTDGLIEAMDGDFELYGTNRLDARLANCGVDAAGLIHSLVDDLQQFVHRRSPQDDVTLLVARMQ